MQTKIEKVFVPDKIAEIKRIVPKTAREYTGNEMIACLKQREETVQKQEEEKLERQKLRKQKKEEKQKALLKKVESKSLTTSRKRAGVQHESLEECN